MIERIMVRMMKVTICDICGDKIVEPFDGSYVVSESFDSSYVVSEWREVKVGTLELCEMDLCETCSRNISNSISLMKENRGGEKQSK